MTQKEFCKKVNEIAQRNIETAQGWIDCYNSDHGTNYFLLNKRIVFKAKAHGVDHIHDGYTWAND